MKTLLLALLTATSINGMAQDNPKFMNVMAVNGLNVRSQPDVNSRIVTKVAYAKKVEILEQTKVNLQLGWITDTWYKVRYRGREGFIFGGYLSELSPPNELKAQTLSDVIPMYSAQVFTMEEQPIVTKEPSSSGDTLKHTLIRFANGVELELEQENERTSSLLILPTTVKETYILLETLLKQSGNRELLIELRFVKGKNGELTRINTADGTISIKASTSNKTSLQLVSYAVTN